MHADNGLARAQGECNNHCPFAAESGGPDWASLTMLGLEKATYFNPCPCHGPHSFIWPYSSPWPQSFREVPRDTSLFCRSDQTYVPPAVYMCVSTVDSSFTIRYTYKDTIFPEDQRRREMIATSRQLLLTLTKAATSGH